MLWRRCSSSLQIRRAEAAAQLPALLLRRRFFAVVGLRRAPHLAATAAAVLWHRLWRKPVHGVRRSCQVGGQVRRLGERHARVERNAAEVRLVVVDGVAVRRVAVNAPLALQVCQRRRRRQAVRRRTAGRRHGRQRVLPRRAWRQRVCSSAHGIRQPPPCSRCRRR
eukprot:351243-Chlamydomonas_euryale.AAC.7